MCTGFLPHISNHGGGKKPASAPAETTKKTGTRNGSNKRNVAARSKRIGCKKGLGGGNDTNILISNGSQSEINGRQDKTNTATAATATSTATTTASVLSTTATATTATVATADGSEDDSSLSECLETLSDKKLIAASSLEDIFDTAKFLTVENDRLKSELIAVKNARADLDKRFEQVRTLLSKKEDEIKVLEEVDHDLCKKNNQQGIELNELQATLERNTKQHEASLTASQADNTSLRRQNEELRQTIDQRNRTNDALRADNEELEEKNRLSTEQHAARTAEAEELHRVAIAGREATIRARDETILQYEADNEELEEKNRLSTEQHAARTAEAEELHRVAIAGREATIRARDETILQNKAEIERLKQDLHPFLRAARRVDARNNN